jgi:predicted Zn-dependent protease
VVLSHEAVADVMDFFGYVGFSAKAYAEGRSFMSNHLEDDVMSEFVTINDDALAPWATGPTFDYEGCPKRITELIEYGVALGPVTDSYWAAKTGWPNTGHALPAPNPWGPMPMNLEMFPGESSLEELIGSVERGVYVTRFHYVNVEDPVPVTLTGMTRDGTFLIEDGRLTRPLKNLRFTQPMVEAFRFCEGVTEERRLVGTEQGASFVPAVLLRAFEFTGRTG